MNKRTISSRILALLMVVAVTISVAAVPADVNAASKKKARKPKVTCSISFKNINGDTVIKKGKKLKVAYSTKSSNGKKVKVRFKSSNRRIAIVTSKGVVKARKNGVVKITATGYVRGRKGGSRTVRIRVGKPVTGISLSGYTYLRAGKSTVIKATVSPKGVSNRRIIWSSSNPKAVKVDQSGRITGVGNGSSVITARAADGSGTIRKISTFSHAYKKADTKWIAHTGFHDYAKPNTAEAFEQAGTNGFWGCECDVWETRHVKKQTREETDNSRKEYDEENSLIADEESDMQNDGEAVVDNTIDDNTLAFDAQKESANEDGAVKDESDNNTRTETIDNMDVEVIPPDMTEINEEEDFDIVINDDATFKRAFGVDIPVKSMSAEEIRINDKLAEVCFLDEFLQICGHYGMVPIIELKDCDMSDAGIEKTIEKVDEAGLLEEAQFISFDYNVLKRTKEFVESNYNISPYIGYLIGGGVNAEAEVDKAFKEGFTGVNIHYSQLTPSINSLCNKYGLKICTWTYGNSAYSDMYLYRHLVSGEYNVFSTTIDGKFF